MNYMAKDKTLLEQIQKLRRKPVDYDKFMAEQKENEITNRLMGGEHKELVDYCAYAEGPNGECMTRRPTEKSTHQGVAHIYRYRGFASMIVPNNPGMYKWTKL